MENKIIYLKQVSALLGIDVAIDLDAEESCYVPIFNIIYIAGTVENEYTLWRHFCHEVSHSVEKKWIYTNVAEIMADTVSILVSHPKTPKKEAYKYAKEVEFDLYKNDYRDEGLEFIKVSHKEFFKELDRILRRKSVRLLKNDVLINAFKKEIKQWKTN